MAKAKVTKKTKLIFKKNDTIGVSATDPNGKVITLLNPSEMGFKYAMEMKNNVKLTNDMKVIKNDSASLTSEERSYRAGFLAAQKASARAYKASKK